MTTIEEKLEKIKTIEQKLEKLQKSRGVKGLGSRLRANRRSLSEHLKRKANVGKAMKDEEEEESEKEDNKKEEKKEKDKEEGNK